MNLGVNLGGWLVLERWITPSLFAGTDAWDEYSLCQIVGRKQLDMFRRMWVRRSDFLWLAEHGFEAVRIPAGYWVFGDEPPYAGTVDFLDKAFKWAEQYDIKILICLHGAPGSQNGQKHSGRAGEVGWHKDPSNIERTLEVVERLAERYAGRPALLGIELLNEPSPETPRRILMNYYKRAYRSVRRICGPDVWVVFSDRFQLRRWAWNLHGPFYRNAVLDTHQYQVFEPKDKALDLAGHLAKTAWIGRRLRWLGWHRRFIVGEWSGALDGQGRDGVERYVHAQLDAYSSADAWFYWTYKTEDGGPWSLRDVTIFTDWRQ